METQKNMRYKNNVSLSPRVVQACLIYVFTTSLACLDKVLTGCLENQSTLIIYLRAFWPLHTLCQPPYIWIFKLYHPTLKQVFLSKTQLSHGEKCGARMHLWTHLHNFPVSRQTWWIQVFSNPLTRICIASTVLLWISNWSPSTIIHWYSAPKRQLCYLQFIRIPHYAPIW